ncbi:tyrosine-protein kinase receptor Tie-1-like [Branchiostoma floridae]|uniref:receptor protein-tyrosine kinase n=1 Tax=Branchiostoma floridae TaxID=7739 RepID=A0A9J7MSP2_BRAFL|nr:tyrosine-protein kinase receptor Tie-1-like [Branchiostoma floridae]
MRKELRMMMKITAFHPNVVSLLGYCSNSESLMLILEYVRHGNLLTVLRNDRVARDVTYKNLHHESKTLQNKDLISFAWQVAKGMAFLASKQCIHRDLAARNVLVGENRTCKISDFGLARDGPEYRKLTQSRLPLRWMAPETLYDRVYSTRSDVWSFGILLYEISTLGSIPYPTISNKEVAAAVQSGYVMPKPAHCTDQLYFLMEKCWDFHPDGRPFFSELSSALYRMLRDEQEHIVLTLFEEHVYANMDHLTDGETC